MHGTEHGKNEFHGPTKRLRRSMKNAASGKVKKCVYIVLK